VPEAIGIRPRFVLPLGYGDFVLDEASRAYLLDHLAELESALDRGAARIALNEEMLGARVSPDAMLELALGVAAAEDAEQIVQLVLGTTREIYWRRLSPDRRRAFAPRLEAALREGLSRAGTPSPRAAYFTAFASMAVSVEGVAFLERVWSRQESIPGLPLAEADEIMLAEQLALRTHPRSAAILEAQRARIENPDRRDRFAFVIPALSPEAGERARFFESIQAPGGRDHVRWVLDGLGFLHHPLRAEEGLRMLRPALTLAPEVERTRVVFFTQSWLRALLGGHSTPEAAEIVRSFLNTEAAEYPPRLRRLVIQAADPLFRAAGD
jgi:aminopeptidase N